MRPNFLEKFQSKPFYEQRVQKKYCGHEKTSLLQYTYIFHRMVRSHITPTLHPELVVSQESRNPGFQDPTLLDTVVTRPRRRLQTSVTTDNINSHGGLGLGLDDWGRC